MSVRTRNVLYYHVNRREAHKYLVNRNEHLQAYQSYLGVAKADVKGLTGNLTNISGSNQIQYSYVEPNKPSVALTVNQVRLTVLS